jgi:pimeloyl-ACP methyl ester carboxylesterase
VTRLQHLTIHGHRVGFRSAGDGPLVVLLHGMAGDSAAWLPVVPALARRFTVIAPDLLGHGTSAKPPGEYSIGAHANLVRDLLAVLGHERATLVGQSFGGGVAMQLAYQFPERCERLVLVSSGGFGREVGPLLRWLSLPGAEHVLPLVCTPRLRDAGSRVAAWLASVGLRAAPATAEMWRSYGALAEPDARRAFFRTLRAVIDTAGQTVNATDRLYLAARVPTLIVWGERDALIPVAHAYAAHAAIPGSRLAIFADAGHFPHCEAPERFAETLIEFIDTTAAPATSEESWRDALRRGRTGRAASSALEGELP